MVQKLLLVPEDDEPTRIFAIEDLRRLLFVDAFFAAADAAEKAEQTNEGKAE